MRISWDQASLLKSVEVIGARSKNWPIRDGKDHVRLISKSASSAPISAVTQQMADANLASRPSTASTTATNDPKASLNLFAPRNVDDEPEIEKVTAPRAAASGRPAPRDYGELFVDLGEQRAPSPTKARGKSGAGKNFRESRILSPEGADARDMSPAKPRNEKKYQHFEFSDGSDLPPGHQPEIPKSRSTRTKHASQWDFEDFVTPSKPASRGRAQEQSNITWEDETDSPPARQPAVHQPRRDQQSQLEFQDDGGEVPGNEARNHRRGVGSMNKDASLYRNLYDENGVPATPTVGDNGIANVKDRQKDFDAHWRMNDDSTPRAGDDIQSDSRAALRKPTSTTTDNKARSKDFAPHFEIKDDGPILSEQRTNRQPGSNAHAKAVNTMQANWQASDSSPGARTAPIGKENRPTRRGAGQPSWGFGETDEQEVKKIYKTAGNGMGSRTGARGWGIGDESGEEEEAPNYAARGKTKRPQNYDF